MFGGAWLDKNKSVNIYEYSDYREFLRDRFQVEKCRGTHFSYRKFSLIAGLSSPNFLKLVIENLRNLSKAGIEKFANGFRLTGNEREYFSCMVLMNQCSSHIEKDAYYRKMIRIRGVARAHVLEQKEYQYYAEWHHSVVREMAGINSGKVSEVWIAEHIQPPVSVTQVRRSLQLLQDLGMIRREDNRWIQTDPIVTTGPEISSLLVTNYHKNMISKAIDSIERFPPEMRDISSVTIRVHPDNLPDIKKAVIAFRKQLLGFEQNGQKNERVMQINIQIFPLSNDPSMGKP